MSWLADLGTAFGTVMSLPVLLAAIGGVAIGVFVGAVPGLTVAVALALGVPFTFTMPPVTALAFLIGIFKGGIFGGSITAILINTPGTAAASATAFDGYPLAQQGRSGKALRMALYASIIGDAFSVMVLILVAQFIARVAIRFGPAEIFSLLALSLTIIAVISGESLIKGFIAAGAGFILSVIGQDPIVGTPRFTFGVLELQSGLDLVAMLIGLFAVSELFVQWELGRAEQEKVAVPISSDPADSRVSRAEFAGVLRSLIRGSVIGVGVGAVPGIGPAVAAFLSYGAAKRSAENPDQFGHGALEGVAAAESGNNAVVAATLIPLLTFGIPGDLMAAILLGAFTLHGIPVGPSLFEQHRDLVFGLYAILLVSIAMLGFVGHAGIWLFRRMTNVPRSYVFSLVAVLSVVGAYSVNNSIFDVYVMMAFGVLGYIMRKFAIPLPPLLIAFVLAPNVEAALRTALILSRGSIDIFVTRPVSLALLVITAAVIAQMSVVQVWRRRRERQQSLDTSCKN